MTTKPPAYAKAKTITSRSGAQAVSKHLRTLTRAQEVLYAQGDEASHRAALLINFTIDAYRQELDKFYRSAHNPYRTLSA